MTVDHPIQDGNPASASIWLIGEAPGADEVSSGRPFSGASGYELNKMLNEAGIDRGACFATNVCHVRPPSYQKNGKWVHNDIDQFFASATVARLEGLSLLNRRFPREPITAGIEHLRRLLQDHRPHLIIALGNTPLWALTGELGITKWRGSVIQAEGRPSKVLPTFHPADVLRAWTHRPIVVQDLRRAAREAEYPEIRRPHWEFTVAPSLSDVLEWFQTYANDSDSPLVCDTEGWGRVDCVGFASDSTHAICIPFTHPAELASPHYWTPEDEFTVTQACRTVLSSRPIIFHNALWDCQVIARRWALLPLLHSDTMVMQHVAFPGLLGGKIDPVTGRVDKKGSSLSLSFIASMYCDYYRYWKDDGRTFDPSIHDERQYWRYNCEDCVRTFECWNALTTIIDRSHLREQLNFEMRLFAPVLSMMFRGMRYDSTACGQQRQWFTGEINRTQEWLDSAVGFHLNPDSTPQMRALFYDDLRVPQLRNRKTGALTLDDPALTTIAIRNPLLRPLVAQIQNYRTLDTLRAALDAAPSPDGRMRNALNIAGVETFRFSSNETAFGEGGNLQNIKRTDGDS